MKEQENKSKQPRTQDEDDGSNRSHGEGTPIYLTSDSTLQSPEEHAHDKSVDPNKDTTMEASNDDLHDIKAGKLTGRDGTNTDQP
ncbi:MAG TPA: hypothetical protein VD794_03560 [Flavisolibacter sp.]|nr:hypothetical protein [Flavisolibacter sp.]